MCAVCHNNIVFISVSLFQKVQFFISNLPQQGVYNTVAEAVRRRISRAHANNETFRVYFVITLLPEVGGKLFI